MSEDQPFDQEKESGDPVFQQEVDRLHQVTVYARWLVVSLLWLTVGALSLWALRETIMLLWEDFTWAAIRYGLVFNRVAAVGLAVCIGSTVGVLLWQSRNILWGLPVKERARLEQQVWRIRQQGSSHPLWKMVCQKETSRK